MIFDINGIKQLLGIHRQTNSYSVKSRTGQFVDYSTRHQRIFVNH